MGLFDEGYHDPWDRCGLGKKTRQTARENGDSLNATLLKLLRRSLGLEKQLPYPRYHDLDSLAGTWTEEDEREFAVIQKGFSRIDSDLWQ